MSRKYVIAYIVNQYPKVSHSFIRREIHALEEGDFDVLRIAIRNCDEELVDPDDIKEKARTRYVLAQGPLRLFAAIFKELIRNPIRFCRALVSASRMSRRSDRPLVIHLAYFAEACLILPWLRRARVEHVHAHFGTNATEVAMLLRELGGPTYSFTSHGPLEFDNAPGQHFDRKVELSSFVVAISSFCSSQLRRWTDAGQWSKIRVIRCGVDATFLQGTCTSPPAALQVVCVGRLCEQKGQLLLVQAAGALTRRGRSFTLVLAGDGEMRAAVEAEIRRQGVADRVTITGWVSNERVRDEVRASRAMVLPSFAEGLPVVIMESLALGRPVLSTYVAGIPELVKPGETGWLVPAGDVAGLADGLCQVLDASNADIERMGNLGSQLVAERHSIANEAGKLADEFRRAIGAARET